MKKPFFIFLSFVSLLSGFASAEEKPSVAGLNSTVQEVKVATLDDNKDQKTKKKKQAKKAKKNHKVKKTSNGD